MVSSQKSEVKGNRAEALAYMPIPRINYVVQGFIPANTQCPSADRQLDYWKLDVDDWILEVRAVQGFSPEARDQKSKNLEPQRRKERKGDPF